mmetsp:Transcript_35802/g.74923  ORF Transcript_35802/g.74923 Transcript_35802/m.74923 type:complete len:183 (+) Transcript_35802:172-720(+)
MKRDAAEPAGSNEHLKAAAQPAKNLRPLHESLIKRRCSSCELGECEGREATGPSDASAHRSADDSTDSKEEQLASERNPGQRESVASLAADPRPDDAAAEALSCAPYPSLRRGGDAPRPHSRRERLNDSLRRLRAGKDDEDLVAMPPPSHFVRGSGGPPDPAAADLRRSLANRYQGRGGSMA